MPTFSRHATVNWTGTLMEGEGTATVGSGAFEAPVSFPRRISAEPEAETTSPEELIAAAHASCYAMVLAGALGRNNASASRTSVTCTLTADKTDAGIKITHSKLDVTVEGLKGLDAHGFEAMAKEAEGRCPVSSALRGWIAIEVTTNVR